MNQGEDDSLIGGCPYEIYLAEGNSLFLRKKYGKALKSFTTALEIRENDKNCLVARSQCYLQLGDATKALADAEKTLQDNPCYIKGILQRAEAYYQMGQFEYALMHFHRGFRLRPEVQAFRLGIQKSQEAIDNCIGEAARIKLTKEGDLSYFNDAKKQHMRSSTQDWVPTGKDKFRSNVKIVEQNTAQGKARMMYQRSGGRETKKKSRRNREDAPDQKTVKQLLGDLYADKEYLEQLLKETESAANQSQVNKEVYTLADECLDYLDTRTAFWQQQKPMYSRKSTKKRKETRTISNKTSYSEWVLKRLEQIDRVQTQGRFSESLKLSKRTLKEVKQVSDEELPNKAEIVASLHSSVGNSYLEIGKYAEALHHHALDHEIGEQQNIEESKSRSLDNLGRVYARMGEYQKAIDIWEQKIPMVQSALECTWLYHELGRCYLELRNYDKAKEYGETSLTQAQEAGDDVWKLNATVLIAQCHVKVKEYQLAIENFEKALDMATEQKDKAAESAIKKAIEDTNRRIVEDVKDKEEDNASNVSNTKHQTDLDEEVVKNEEKRVISPTRSHSESVSSQFQTIKQDIVAKQITSKENSAPKNISSDVNADAENDLSNQKEANPDGEESANENQGANDEDEGEDVKDDNDTAL